MGAVPNLSTFMRSATSFTSSTPGDQAQITEFHLTGFSRFHNVSVNPTETLINTLPRYLSDHPLQSHAILASATILKVSADTSRNALESMYKQLNKPTHAALQSRTRGQRRIVFVHLGVNMRASHFQLEIQARNEATFSCPDELGWTPIKRPIDKNNSDISAVCLTSLHLDAMLDQLNRQDFDVQISTDAGRFVCNWVYYNSLKLSQINESCALFVHVPPATKIPIETQLRFVAALLNCIATLR